MKPRTILFSLAAALLCIAAYCFVQSRCNLSGSDDETEESAEENRHEIFEGYMGVPELADRVPQRGERPARSTPLFLTQQATGSPASIAFKQKAAPVDHATAGLNLDFLQKYEGSYSNEDLFGDDREHSSLIIPLNSRWFYRNSDTPHFGLQLWKNPDTEEYELVGGKIMFSSGFGATYEQIQNTDEKQFFLRYEKKF